MVAQLQVGIDIVGKIKKTYEKKGVITQVFGTSHSKKYAVQWEDGGSTTESTRGICLHAVCLWAAKSLTPAKGKKRPREVLQDDENSHLPLDDDSEDESEESSTDEEVDNSGEPHRYARCYIYVIHDAKFNYIFYISQQ